MPTHGVGVGLGVAFGVGCVVGTGFGVGVAVGVGFGVGLGVGDGVAVGACVGVATRTTCVAVAVGRETCCCCVAVGVGNVAVLLPLLDAATLRVQHEKTSKSVRQPSPSFAPLDRRFHHWPNR